MGSSSKGGGAASKSYDYYATFALVFRAGRVETLHTLMVDGKALWDGPINRTDGGVSNPYTLTIADSKWVRPGGYVKFYWGEDTQTTPDAALTDHPPYRGFAYMVFHKFLCGRERTTIPNIELVAEAKAEPGTVITGSANDSGCCNPWAIAAEFLQSRHAAGLPAARLDATSFQDAHDYAAASSERKLLTYCAPILTSRATGREFLIKLLSLVDGTLRLKPDNTIEAVYYPTDPGTLSDYASLTENDFVQAPKIDAETWDAVPTGIVLSFSDRDRHFKRADQFVPHLLALQTVGEARNEQIDMSDFITRGDQAAKVAAMIAKRYCVPRLSGTVTVRPEKAIHPAGHPLAGDPIRPGDRFQLDVDIEPGGSGLAQLARCLGRSFGMTGGVKLRWESEANQPALPFTPTYTPPGIVDLEPTNITQARIIAMPPALAPADGLPYIAVLAERPDDMVVGAQVEFDVDDGTGDFTTLGEQIGFATYGLIDGAYSDTATGAVRVDLNSTRDLHLVTRDVGETGAANDELLLIIYTIDGGAPNYIDDDTNGFPELEIFSIESSAVVSGQKYDFTCLRSRLGTTARSFADNASCFIIPRSSLVPFTHPDFIRRINEAVVFEIRLRSFNRFAAFDGSLTDFHGRFPPAYRLPPIITWVNPSGSSDSTDGSGNYSPDADVVDNDGNLVRMELFHTRTDTDAITKVLDAVFPATSAKALPDALTDAGVSTTVNFAGQASADTVYLLTLRATDSDGQIVESTRTILRGPTSGSSSTPPPPDIENIGAGTSGGWTCRITRSGSATEVHYKRDFLFNSSPPGSYSTSSTNPLSIAVLTAARVWARASDGANHSAWVFEDFV
jgi:hypothetical protein